MPSPILQFKRGLLANLPGLRNGEPGFTTDSYDLYVGIDSTTNNNKFFGSHRYWTRETTTTGSGVNLVEGTNNGAHYITLAAPASVGAAVTYYFPASNGNASSTLTNDGSGNLSWSSGSANAVFTGITTFTDTTDNTFGNENTGSVQLDGGMGIAKNLTVKNNLHVGGYAEFVGVVTFKGGTINIGDGDTDDINVGGEFISSLRPSTDNAYDLGITTQRWRSLNVVSIATTNISVAGLTTTKNLVVFDTVGIGTTNPLQRFQIGTANTSVGVGTTGIIGIGTNLITGINTTGILLGFFVTNANVSSGTTVISLGISTVGISKTTTNVGIATTTFTFTPDNTKVFVVTADADVGIGTTNPQYKLDVRGAVYIEDDLTVDGGDVQSSNASLNLFNTNVTTANVLGAGTDILFGATTGITTVRNNLTVGGDLRINGNDIQASDGNANITLTSNTLTAFVGDIKVGGNDIQASDGTTAITLSGADVTVAGDIRINGNDIKASDGTTAITLAGNDVTVADDLTVQGNLYVNGSTTQVNTAALTVEDRTIDLGIVDGAAPASNTTWDLGILFNYYSSSDAKKSAVIWEHGDSRFKFASVLAADTVGIDSTTPQLTVTTFAPIEIASLFVNDCAGASQVISCTGTERFLENITVDCGSF